MRTSTYTDVHILTICPEKIVKINEN